MYNRLWSILYIFWTSFKDNFCTIVVESKSMDNFCTSAQLYEEVRDHQVKVGETPICSHAALVSLLRSHGWVVTDSDDEAFQLAPPATTSTSATPEPPAKRHRFSNDVGPKEDFGPTGATGVSGSAGYTGSTADTGNTGQGGTKLKAVFNAIIAYVHDGGKIEEFECAPLENDPKSVWASIAVRCFGVNTTVARTCVTRMYFLRRRNNIRQQIFNTLLRNVPKRIPTREKLAF